MLSLYAKGLTTGEISAHFAEIYGASVSKETVSRITDRVIEEMQAWATRPLDEVYAAIFIDAMVVKIRDGQVGNRPIYAAIGVSLAGERDILGLWAGSGGEGAKFWMSVLTDIRNRGVRDTFFVVCDGLKGLAEVVGNVWPAATVQTCIIHLIRNTFRLTSRQLLGRAQARPQTRLHRGERGCGPGVLRRGGRQVGRPLPGRGAPVEQRLGGVHPVLGLRPRDPPGVVFHQRHREPQRPLPPGRASPRPFPDRGRRHEMSLPGDQIT